MNLIQDIEEDFIVVSDYLTDANINLSLAQNGWRFCYDKPKILDKLQREPSSGSY